MKEEFSHSTFQQVAGFAICGGLRKSCQLWPRMPGPRCNLLCSNTAGSDAVNAYFPSSIQYDVPVLRSIFIAEIPAIVAAEILGGSFSPILVRSSSFARVASFPVRS